MTKCGLRCLVSLIKTSLKFKFNRNFTFEYCFLATPKATDSHYCFLSQWRRGNRGARGHFRSFAEKGKSLDSQDPSSSCAWSKFPECICILVVF